MVAWRVPPNGGHRLSGDGDWHALKSLFADRQWHTFLGSAVLSTISNGAVYAFFPRYLNRVGLGDNWQCYFWVIAVLAEIAFMAKLAATNSTDGNEGLKKARKTRAAPNEARAMGTRRMCHLSLP